MKKVLTICLSFALLMALAVGICATPGAFYESVSGKDSPVLVSGENVSDECNAEVIVTPYSKRDTLPSDLRQLLEYAYQMIIGVESPAELCEALNGIAAAKGITAADLAVSDLFDVHATECTNGHELHGHFDITLKADLLKNFVALIHYHNGEWHVVESAQVTNNGEHLEFDAEHFSPFAIVISTAEIETDAPGTSDTNNLWLYVAALSAVAIVVVVILLAKKKREAE